MRNAAAAAAAFYAALALVPLSAVAATAPAREHVPGGTLMLAAYIIIWAVPLLLVWRSHRQLGELEARTRDMEQIVERAKEQLAP